MSFYSDQAAQFTQTAKDIQTRLTNDGAAMDESTYKKLETQRDSLLNKSAVIVALDVKGTLAQMKGVDQPRLAKSTANLDAAVQTLKKFDQLAAIAASAVTLATAIAAANPGAIVSGIAGAEKALAEAAASPQPQLVATPKPQSKAAAPIALAAAAAPARTIPTKTAPARNVVPIQSAVKAPNPAAKPPSKPKGR